MKTIGDVGCLQIDLIFWFSRTVCCSVLLRSDSSVTVSKRKLAVGTDWYRYCFVLTASFLLEIAKEGSEQKRREQNSTRFRKTKPKKQVYPTTRDQPSADAASPMARLLPVSERGGREEGSEEPGRRCFDDWREPKSTPEVDEFSV